jgi:hypothetical protein
MQQGDRMSLSVVVPLAVFFIFAIAVAWFASKIVKLGGIRSVAFGAPIVRTVGEVTHPDGKGGNVTLRVHALAGGTVGLELVTKSSYSYKALAMSLPAAPAKELISLLQAATNERFAA